ncbi:phosphoserine phosphatase SerB [Pseudoalteromonas luteoviolacea]|uniref:Phosphoserine phosphatase n=1 Tax=Pseudoalteromonas luteoviolacea TaxID=43657 RepID=A0A1C0TQC2_9GAMM|nr:phosphoserine phosphatase SerB [Pseudoalteromonas luteoviolacea]OCQ21086.1 phosphoserine phosphatase SerB [Pseudoalteromonas luteoviolacea]
MQNVFDISQLDVRPIENQLTLAKWYPFENGQCSDVKVEQNATRRYIVLFGCELTGSQVAKFITSLDLPLAYHRICCFEAHQSLPLGVAIEISSSIDIKQSVRNTASQVGCQGAVLHTLPQLSVAGLLVMDMDSTAIEIECIDEIARLADVYDEVAAVTAQAMAGQLAFNDSLHQRVAKLKGIPLSLIEPLKANLPLMAGIKALCVELKTHGWHLAIASGGFTWFAQAVQAQLDLDCVFANTLEIADQHLTGKVLGDVVDAQKKAEVLKSLQAEFKIAPEQTLAMGDGANDLVMMAAADLGIAVHGKPKVVEQADTAICHGSLLQVLYFLTVPRPE